MVQVGAVNTCLSNNGSKFDKKLVLVKLKKLIKAIEDPMRNN